VALPSLREGIFFWGSAEFATYRDMRNYLRKEVGLPPSQVVAFSHWRRGVSEEDIAQAGASMITA
jgi:NADPH-dependent ferric siderophore reductase